MHADRFAQIKALFNAVCDLDPPQREQQLRELSDDPTLIGEVRQLLQQTGGGAGALDRPLLQALTQLAGDELRPGDRLGPWTLVGELGHGGMGTVYKAQRSDGHFEQVAAIKVLRGIPDNAALTRLAQERQILARMSHPHIARLLDGGATESGQPYLVMEYIEGEPVDQFCSRLRLTPAAIIRQLLGVCEALEFAHQRLIVHCDLKPGNILVDREGRTILLDFGIAKLLGDDTTATSASQAAQAFTPGFASPEQTSGSGVSVASDLFGLGRVLQLLLQRSVDADSIGLQAAPPAGAEAAASAEPLPAAIPTALAAIVRHCTDVDPGRRYLSASLLAEDLRRWLGNRPVRAMGNNRLYRIHCFLRRNALPLGLGILAAVALIGGLLSTSLSLREARAQHSRAEIAGKRAERTADFLGNLLSAVDPDRARDLDKTLLRELLEQAATRAQTELADEPLVLTGIAEIIGSTYYRLGEYQPARRHLQQALQLQPAESLRKRLRLREQIADAVSAMHDNQEAGAEYQAIYNERLAAFGADDPDTLASAYALIFQLVNTGQYPRAAVDAAHLQPRLEQVRGEHDPVTLANLQSLAVARTELGEFAAAEPMLQTLIERHEQVYGPFHSKTLSIQNSLAILYLRQQRFADAQLLLRRLQPEAVKHLGATNFKAMNMAALLAAALRKGGKLAESGPYYQLALDSAFKAFGADSPITLRYEFNYANYEIDSGLSAAALARCERVQPALLAALGPDHPDLGELYRTKAKALTALGRKPEALALWQQALALDRKVFGDDQHPQIVDDLAAIAVLQ